MRIIDYFLSSKDLYFKILIKDNLFFNKDYFANNHYELDRKDMAYVSAYAELCRSIKPNAFEQQKKLLNIDDKGFKGNVILPQFMKQKMLLDMFIALRQIFPFRTTPIHPTNTSGKRNGTEMPKN